MSRPPLQQKALRPCLALLLALSLAQSGCDSIVTPTGPEQVSVHLWADFKDDKVVIKLDGDRVFSERVTTDHRIGVAGGIDLSITEGVHRIQVIVNGWPSTAREFVAGSIVVIGVDYDRSERAIGLAMLVEPPLYD